MISLFPATTGLQVSCTCGAQLKVADEEILWQGPHVCIAATCTECGKEYIADLPVGQGKATPCLYDKKTKQVVGLKPNWYSQMMNGFDNPIPTPVKVDIEQRSVASEVIFLNTVDMCYGHSLLFLFNLSNMIKQAGNRKIIVLVQPMLRWLVPQNEAIAEVWVVHLSFRQAVQYYSAVTEQVNQQLKRFEKVWLSSAHLLPSKIHIEQFTGVAPFDFATQPDKPRITFIWREDAGRLWIRNRYIRYGFDKSGLSIIAKTISLIRVKRLFHILKNRLGNDYRYTVAGLGKFGTWPAYVGDKRVEHFDDAIEKQLCKVYAESILVVGVHGSSMLLPSSHAGMAVSLMPPKRWGNYLEDLLIAENDTRMAAFQKRVLPMRLPVKELADICIDMIKGRSTFIKKFIYAEEEI